MIENGIIISQPIILHDKDCVTPDQKYVTKPDNITYEDNIPSFAKRHRELSSVSEIK